MSDSFDILAGPEGSDGGKKTSHITLIVTALFFLISVAGAILLSRENPALITSSILIVVAVTLIGVFIGRVLQRRSEAKKSWMETEIELAWFRNLKVLADKQEQTGFWAEWESTAKGQGTTTTQTAYAEGYKSGYGDGLAAAGGEPIIPVP